MRIRVGDISKINELSLLKNDSFDTILYLDTSNLTENKVDTLQKIDLSIDKLPSRAKRKVRKNTILFSNVRPIQRHYGLLEETPNNLIVSTGFTTLNPDDSVIDEYFLYYLLTQDSTINYLQMIAENSVSSYPSITSNDIADLNFVIPDSIEEQKRTVKIIKLIDQKIALNNQINEELEAMAKTLYDYWFVQFDFPNENGKPYKSSGGKMDYNDQLKREIPEGWGVKQLGEISNIVMGQSPSGTSYNDIGEGTVFYQGSTDFGWRYPNVRQYTTAPTRYANENDILLSVRAPVGTLNIANETCCIGRGLAAINSKSGYNSFLFQQMQLYKKEFQLRDATGTTFGSITKDDLFSLSMVTASENLMKRYENIVGKSYDKIKILSKQNQELTQLRDWLLPMLMNGQVKVEE